MTTIPRHHLRNLHRYILCRSRCNLREDCTFLPNQIDRVLPQRRYPLRSRIRPTNHYISPHSHRQFPRDPPRHPHQRDNWYPRVECNRRVRDNRCIRPIRCIPHWFDRCLEYRCIQSYIRLDRWRESIEFRHRYWCTRNRPDHLRLLGRTKSHTRPKSTAAVGAANRNNSFKGGSFGHSCQSRQEGHPELEEGSRFHHDR